MGLGGLNTQDSLRMNSEEESFNQQITNSKWQITNIMLLRSEQKLLLM
jgi:hypothetical protein